KRSPPRSTHYRLPMIRLGLQIPSFTDPGVPDDALFERVSEIAVTAEESGFDSVWVMDHFYQLPLLGPPTLNMLESYTLLGALAARTKSVQLGTLVTGVTYRNPAVLAKEVTTLDVIASGRAILGIGAAWLDVLYGGHGVLEQHCANEGRDPATINKTKLGTLFIGRDHDEAQRKLVAQLAERGMDWDTLDDATRAQLTAMFHVGGPDEIAGEVKAYLDA